MILLLITTLAAATADPLPACSAAMRGLGTVPAETILKACPEPGQVDLWSGKDRPCDGAIKFARMAAQSAHGLPPVMMQGLIREFDRRAAACANPVKKQQLPVDDCKTSPKLWC